MTLKVNSMYKIKDGYIIPRSKFGDAMPRYAIVEILKGGETHWIKTHTTFTAKDFRQALFIGQKEKIEII